MKNTKIIITIGPACFSEEKLGALLDAGVNCIRINFSHTKTEDIKSVVSSIRGVSEKKHKEVAILGDISGPKLRVDGVPPEGIQLKSNSTIRIARNSGKALPFFTLPEIFDYVDCGERIFFDDRKIEGEIIEKASDTITVRIKNPSTLLPKKGLNLPDSDLGLSVLSEKDLRDIEAALLTDIDYFAVSFVRNAEDVLGLKRIIHSQKKIIPIISKIERKDAVRNIEEIIDASDGVMVARGDLGVEMDLDSVPSIQKDIIKCANKKGKLVIVATQIMESMINNPSPTRAEVSDIANAIYDGADVLMLSGETSVGKYPVETVNWLSKISLTTENSLKKNSGNIIRDTVENRVFFSANAIAHSAYYTAIDTKASAIICITNSGATSLLISKYRPEMPIFALSNNKSTIRKVELYRGVTGYLIDFEKSEIDYESLIRFIMKKHNFKMNDTIVLTQGFPPGIAGTTNSIAVFKVGQTLKKKSKEIKEFTSEKITLYLDKEKCLTCGICEELCPVNIFNVELKYMRINRKNLNNCLGDMICVKHCPVKALKITKKGEKD
ncbi:MAG: pyruvate kinase [bacterium]|nr:pyruvate kinase [bacterium]